MTKNIEVQKLQSKNAVQRNEIARLTQLVEKLMKQRDELTKDLKWMRGRNNSQEWFYIRARSNGPQHWEVSQNKSWLQARHYDQSEDESRISQETYVRQTSHFIQATLGEIGRWHLLQYLLRLKVELFCLTISRR